VNIFAKGENPKLESQVGTRFFPVIALMDRGGKYSGLNFHGIPGGHELAFFILAIYNIAGPGRKIDGGLLAGGEGFEAGEHQDWRFAFVCGLPGRGSGMPANRLFERWHHGRNA